MANPDRQTSPEIKRSEQAIQNWSFDEVYKVLAMLLLGEYNGGLYRLQVDADGNLKISGSFSESTSVIDSNNSTTTPLGSSGVFTGTATDVTNYEAVYIQLISDKASATNGLEIQTSDDGVNWDHKHRYTYGSDQAGSGYHWEEALPGKYFRVVYTNTNSAQTYLRLQCKLLKRPASSHVHPISYSIDTDHPAAITRSVITGQTTAGGGALVNVKVNPSGTMETNANLAAGANLIGAATPGASASVGTGKSHFRNSAVSNTAVAIKASAGKLHGYNLYNPNSSLAFVHFYDVAAASVVVGTTTPKRSIALPSTSNGTVGVDRCDEIGIAFATAMSVACTTTVDGSTAPSAGIIVNAEYI